MILSIFMISVGILVLFFSIIEHDKNVMNKYKTIKFFLDIIIGIFYIVAGVILLFKLISAEYIGLIVVIFGIINMIIERKIK